LYGCTAVTKIIAAWLKDMYKVRAKIIKGSAGMIPACSGLPLKVYGSLGLAG